MKLSLRCASITGPGHLKVGLPNQDSCLTRAWNGQWLVVVCDGMGSRQNADVGAFEACRAVLETIRVLDFNSDDKDLIQGIYTRWLCRLKKVNVPASSAVTTCLLAWGLNNGSFRYAHLGDGAIVSEHDVLSVALSEGFSNETTGLGISDRFSDWRYGKGTLAKNSRCLLLMSDGVSDDVSDLIGFSSEIRRQLSSRSTRGGKAWLKKTARELADARS